MNACTGRELVGRFDSYEGPIFDVPPRDRYPILTDDFVTTEDGTGIVHLAPAFGEDDYRVAAEHELFDPARPETLLNPVRPDGTFDERVQGCGGASFEGRYVKDEALTQELIEDLDARGLLLRAEEYEHSYPHCWRSDDALIYYAKPSWYISTSQLRERAAERERDGRLVPAARQGGPLRRLAAQQRRLGALARALLGHAAAGVALRSNGHVHVVGSFGELAERSGAELATTTGRSWTTSPSRARRPAARSRCAACRR